MMAKGSVTDGKPKQMQADRMKQMKSVLQEKEEKTAQERARDALKGESDASK